MPLLYLYGENSTIFSLPENEEKWHTPFFPLYDGKVELFGGIALPKPSYAPNLVIRWRPAINNNDWVTGESSEPYPPPLSPFFFPSK